jgi:hypothetical protein
VAASAADPNAGVDGLISDCSNRHGMPIALELRDALRHFRLSEPEPASSVEVASGCGGRGVAGLRGCPGLSGSATWSWLLT